MKNAKKFWGKLVCLAILALALTVLDIDKVSNFRDFFIGTAWGVIIVIMLELVYSLIRSLCENSNGQS